MYKFLRVILISAFLLSGIFIAFIALKPSLGSPIRQKGYINWSAEHKKWEEYAGKVGPQKAYHDVILEYGKASRGEQHLSLHFFGDILYEKLGTKAITVCDSTYLYACYHGVFAAAVEAKGIGVASSLYKICAQSFNGFAFVACIHGIGHGILEYEGYNKLIEALNRCQDPDPEFGCRDGVFMEYNFPLALTQIKIPHRTFNSSDPYAPCPTLPEKFRNGCYYRLPQFWSTQFKNNPNKIKELCTKVDGVNKMACLKGIGLVENLKKGSGQPNL